MHLQANGIGVEVDVQGRADGEPLLLIMGLGMQLIAWHQAYVDALVQRGFRVVRFDNRDVGLSQHLDHLGTPNVLAAVLRYSVGLPVRCAYTLEDMADDAAGVLDALGIARAHVCGASMGGMIAQVLATRHAARVSSLTLMMTSSGARDLPKPTLRVRRAMASTPRSSDPAAHVDHLHAFFTLTGSPGYRADPLWLRQQVEAAVRRSHNPAGAARQLMAVAAHGDRSASLARIRAPTHIIHGLADPLVPVACGRDLQRKIPGATADFIEGLAHDLPLALAGRMADGIAGAARRARPVAAAC